MAVVNPRTIAIIQPLQPGVPYAHPFCIPKQLPPSSTDDYDSPIDKGPTHSGSNDTLTLHSLSLALSPDSTTAKGQMGTGMLGVLFVILWHGYSLCNLRSRCISGALSVFNLRTGPSSADFSWMTFRVSKRKLQSFLILLLFLCTVEVCTSNLAEGLTGSASECAKGTLFNLRFQAM